MSNVCPECKSANTANNRRVWRKENGKRIQVMQFRCKDCGRLFIPKS